MLRTNFKSKLLILFIALLSTVLLLSIFLFHFLIVQETRHKSFESVKHVEAIVANEIRNQSKFLQGEAKIVVSNISFNQILAKNDYPSTLLNLQTAMNQLGAARALIVDKSGYISIDSQAIYPAPVKFENVQNFKIEHESEGMIYYQSQGDGIFQWLVLPISGSGKQDSIAFGFEVGKDFTEKLSTTLPANVQLAFFTKNKNGDWSALDITQINSLSPNLVASKQRVFNEAFNDSKQIINLNHWFLKSIPLHVSATKNGINLLIMYSTESLQMRFHTLYVSLAVISLLAIVIACMGMLLILRHFFDPLKQIVQKLELVQRGNYHTKIKFTRDDELGKLAKAFNHMIEAIGKREDKILYQSRHHASTGLPNRSLIEKKVEEIIVRVKHTKDHDDNLVVILLSVDKFLEINYTLGHEVGDQLIQYIAAKLKSRLHHDALLGYFTENLFCIVMSVKKREDVNKKLTDILDMFDKVLKLDEVSVDVRLRIGLSFYPEHANTARGLFQCSEVALYLARQTTSDFMVYDPELDPYSKQRLSLMSELMHGIENNEFKIYYQPKVDGCTGEIHSAEALVRWEHPVRGFLSPDEFIPLAEQTGHIYRLTQWVLTNVIRQMEIWQRFDKNITISVNLSRKDITNKNLKKYLEELMSIYDVKPSALVLEITESAVMENPDTAIKMIKSIGEMGITFSLDDFGTGYASLESLKNLPISELKIDKCFVHDIATNENDKTIVLSTIDLGHKLGLNVTAEGVEDEAAQHILENGGCNTLQGYLFSKPIPSNEFSNWLTGDIIDIRRSK